MSDIGPERLGGHLSFLVHHLQQQITRSTANHSSPLYRVIRTSASHERLPTSSEDEILQEMFDKFPDRYRLVSFAVEEHPIDHDHTITTYLSDGQDRILYEAGSTV